MEFYIDPYNVLLWVHVLLFGYWLGSDLGVYYCDSQLTREDLDLAERLRVREIRLKLDLVPRFCLIILLALGLTMATRYGSPITGAWLIPVWVIAVVWIYVIITIYKGHGSPAALNLNKWDIRWRHLMTTSLCGFSLYCIITGGPISDHWLQAKIFIFGLIILNGVWIRIVAARWKGIFEMVAAGGEQRVLGEAAMKVNRREHGWANMTIWTLVCIVAFLGKVKPF